MKNYAIYNLKVILFIVCNCIMSFCSAQKNTAPGRGMQNLTARYNYIYNSKVLLVTHQQELADTYVDNYDQLLPVYLGPEIDYSEAITSLNLKPMNDIIKKAQVIILEKNNSNYIDDAYILLGKANFYNGNYFNASEYFDYTAKTYRDNINSCAEALNWKTRSLMQLKRITAANKTLDTLETLIPDLKSKSILSESFATMAQMCIYLNNDAAAISYLKDAIKSSSDSRNKIRWTYILAQLYEKQKNYQQATIAYRKVVKSNAPFEMYFNANLNQIKIKALTSGIKTNRQAELLSLLKDDKNFDFNDQIYYQIAETYVADEAYQKAEKYYFLSVQNSTNNQYQKGLSYLKIADLNFKQFRNYLKAKSYYDSTVNTLPKTYPGYELILKKNQNLEYLTKRYQVITVEDTLQAIAKLPEASRAARILAFASPVVETPAATTNNRSAQNYNPASYSSNLNRSQQPQSSFYFSNPMAVSIGLSDFKRKWGNRKLENNWRQSLRTSGQETAQELVKNTSNPENPDDAIAASPDKDVLTKKYTDNLPVTPELLAVSNQKIIDAYYEIASFYLQELNDPKEAEEVYKILLERFPANNHMAATYYSMFLINKDVDEARSNDFKNRVLKDFPTSIYAKIILDPSFSVKQSEMEAAVHTAYNNLFEQYVKKDFNTVIQRVNDINSTNPDNYLSPQFAYLKAIAIGRTNNVDTLITAFNGIISRFPDDKLINPLVKDHLAYIDQHLADFKKRKIALIDFDPNEPPFSGNQQFAKPVIAKVPQPAGQPVTPPATPKKETIVKAPVKAEPVVKTEVPVQTATPVKTDTLVKVPAPVTAAPKIKTPFSTDVSTVYYYVVDVADASLTLSSSRFGIGQFNRGNYSGSNLKHQLKEFDNDQLIYVGNFSNFDDVKAYAAGIDPQLKQIMKVPVNIYTSFIISKENFDKITSKALLNMYIEFYKNNY